MHSLSLALQPARVPSSLSRVATVTLPPCHSAPPSARPVLPASGDSHSFAFESFEYSCSEHFKELCNLKLLIIYIINIYKST